MTTSAIALRRAAGEHPIARYVVKRLIVGVVMLAFVSVAIFFFTQALPGDVARQVLGQSATPDQIASLREQLGLDRPVVVQYFDWVGGLFTGELGRSLTSGLPVAEAIAPRVANSAVLVGVTVAILFPLALAMGATAAARPRGIIDGIVTVLILLVIALPEFIIAILVIVILATNVVKLFPPTSIIDSSQPLFAQTDLLVLPVLALVIGGLPYFTESIRTTLREELMSEYVTWARLTGIRERRVLWRYALPNGIGPALQVAGTTLVYLTGGIVAVESVFAFPGIGAALTAAVANRDLPTVQTITMLMAAVALIIYLVADVCGILLTPKLRSALAS
ncbi:ABC transporter permease [Ruicaihuangia caeni]|uniref:ABC transporter permease n=1 Tax=Ruicaihuangia caeni TaxID=3042517 RepID=A0AAW6TAW9_9MICO|nr:ABC transporter permease [Klugiella sp. YN-L-19]MDI2098727.1 ABC transporter permease [Klugiella sp. YN-L-19]